MENGAVSVTSVLPMWVGRVEENRLGRDGGEPGRRVAGPWETEPGFWCAAGDDLDLGEDDYDEDADFDEEELDDGDLGEDDDYDYDDDYDDEDDLDDDLDDLEYDDEDDDY